MSRLRIGLNGFHKRSLQSVETMRQHYIRALSASFDTYVLDEAGRDESLQESLDAVITYYDPSYWSHNKHPQFPLLFAIHGDAISRRDFLHAHLGNLETTDTLLVNNLSDIQILKKMVIGPTPIICHIHFPVDTDIFHKWDRNPYLASLPFDKVDYVIGFAGRLIPQKNLHQFLVIFACLKSRLSPRRLVGVIAGKYCKAYPVLDYGTDGYEQYIESMLDNLGLRGDLYFCGEVPPDRLAQLYSSMDLLIHPTNNLEEAFGSVPVEAMACGVPVVGAAYGGLKNTIVSGQTGFLMPTWVTRTGIRMDIPSGIEVAYRLLTNTPLRTKMSEVCISRARIKYSYENFSKRLCAGVIRAIEQRRHGASQPILVAEREPNYLVGGGLPEISKPWEAYVDLVAEYVSGPRPDLRPTARLQVAGLIRPQTDGTYLLDDPAWPARFRLRALDIEILRHFEKERSVGEIGSGSIPIQDVERLIDWGLLICSDPEAVERAFVRTEP